MNQKNEVKIMKVLIFGPANAGKTSLMRTTCLGYNFMKVLNLKPTKGISRENFIFRGLAELNVWDAGGQAKYMERYFSESQRELIFSEITTPIFMVDSTAKEDRVKEVFDKFLTYVFEFSPHIDRVYVLLNKIDLENSQEDEVYELLSKNFDEELKQKIYFTPVSVKEGSAQHRLIEILDYEIQRSTLSLQKLGKIRHLLDEMKIDTLSEYLLFNKPDGLLISSTFGKFESKPLEFMKFEIGTLDSNIYQIYTKIMDLLKVQDVSPLELSTIVYQSDTSYVMVRNITNTAVLMAVTKNKSQKVFIDVIEVLNGEKYKSLMRFLRKSEI
ncbi:MAG: ADP-ribosylation factor-like protein [Candidatus Lokiarchaeota archaeon]